MDSTQNFIDAWMNTQSKLVDNLVDTSKKIQESIKKNEIVGKSVEMYSNWFDKQRSLTDSMLNMLNVQGDTESKGKASLKNWVEIQMELSKKWAELLSSGSSKIPKNLMDTTGQMSNMQNMYAEWQNMYGNLFSTKPSIPYFMQSFGQTPNFSNLHQLIDNTRTYMKMFEMWQPIYKMVQSNSVGLDSLNKMLDMDKYQEILGSIFQFADQSKSHNFLNMIQQLSEMTMHTLNINSERTSFMDNIQQFVPNANFSTLSQISQQFNEQFQKMIHPHFMTVPASPEKEMAGLMMDIQTRYTRYYIKSSEMQNTIYVAGQKAMEVAVQEVMQKAQKGNEAIGFDEFYNTWVGTMEEEIISLFGGDTYSKLQGDLLKIGLEIKAKMDSLMEQILAPLPLVPRSEIDELNSTIYELKNKVRSLEQKINKNHEEEKA